MPDKLTGQIRRDLAQVLAIFIAVMAVYLWSMPKTVVLEDDGTFILVAWFNSIAHPPGSPLYTLLAHLASQVPVGTVVARVHAFSALLGAGACVVLWYLVLRLLQSRLLASAAALVFAFSQAFWSQAIIAEVYALNVFLFLLLFLMCLQYRDNSGSRALFCLICFIYGLALSNHWPLLLLSSPLLLAVLWPVITTIKPKIVPGLCCLIAGLLPYLWLVINSRSNPVISFYGPIESMSDFLFMVSRQGYEPIDTSSTAGLEDRIFFIGFVLQELMRQFQPFGISVCSTGVYISIAYLAPIPGYRLAARFHRSDVYSGNSAECRFRYISSEPVQGLSAHRICDCRTVAGTGHQDCWRLDIQSFRSPDQPPIINNITFNSGGIFSPDLQHPLELPCQ